MIVLGVDLGLRGAVACLDNGKVLWVEDMPTSIVAVGKRVRGTIDVAKLHAILSCDNDDPPVPHFRLVVEDIYHMGFRGSLAARAAGVGWGMVKMACCIYGYELRAVAPNVWKRAVLAGRAKGKGAARARAEELFPGVDLGKRADEGRAEALLLAWWGAK